ncbi:DUF5808 domain-containing protein [Paenibacillus typhae]|uniref:DUF5808 domain-containing protein n=1 Tax=Paenibacillus typhae TaxID=1174501 RepID=A0A1G9FVZ6_9BACL|nr:DUF5808 domain-containing protein [Paenibacillus typhae]MBY0011339.1 hypothetical protein [Paenibacillus typhae]SDK92522.1 hypothetical protein SAMN05216192_16132 [Paenibacillus typhae]
MSRKNKSNHTLFVPKSSGIGWTINPRHPLGWMVLIFVFIVAVYLIFFG